MPANAPLPPDPFLDDLFASALAALDAEPKALTKAQIEREMARCGADPVYFVETYVRIYDSVTRGWILFKLWPAQKQTIRDCLDNKYLVVMKARQMGFTWLLGDALVLWQMLFQPIAQILIFSQREDEAKKLLERITDSFDRLPDWMKPPVMSKNTSEFGLDNGSSVQALPGSAGGRSNAATFVLIDEADFVENLGRLIAAAKPTIDAGANKMVVLSTVNVEEFGTPFQNLYTMARDGVTTWRSVFFGWSARPDRTREWYEREKEESFKLHGSYDHFYKEYPTTDVEALAARSLNTRFQTAWLSAVWKARAPLPPGAGPLLPGLLIYLPPRDGHRYGIGVDPAGGLNDGDESALCVLDAETLEQCAVIQNKVEPTEFANMSHVLSVYYRHAPVLFELNNHGTAFLAQARERGMALRMGMNRRGRTERDPGWITSQRSKGALYDAGATALQEALLLEDGKVREARAILFDTKTVAQLGTIDVNTLAAPGGAHDDAAMAWVLACMCVDRGGSDMTQVPHDLWQAPSPLPRAGSIPFRSAWASPAGESQAAINEKLRARGLL